MWQQKPKKVQKTKVRKNATPRRMLVTQIMVGVVLLGVLSGLGYGTWYVTRLPNFTITTTEVVGGSTVPVGIVQEAVEQELVGAYFHLVPKRFYYTYPEALIGAAVREIDRVKNVYVERIGDTVHVAFDEYQPTALWCQEVASKDCLFLDAEGLAFAPAPYLEGAAFLRFSDTARAPVRDEQVFDQDYLADTLLFVENAYNILGFNITHVARTTEDEIEYHVSGGGVIKVSTRMSVADTLENLEAVLVSDTFAHLDPGSFNYIDLRYGEKVFISEVGDESVIENAATSTLTDDGA